MERKNDVASSHQAATDSSCFEVRQSHSYNIHKRCVGGEQFHALFPATNGQRHHLNQDADAYQPEVQGNQPPPRPFPVHQPGHDEIDRAKQNKTEERSEEHTSELQSRPHLVCRLLLEKKKKKKKTHTDSTINQQYVT